MASDSEITGIWNLLHSNYSYFGRQLQEQYGSDKAADMLDKLLSGIWIPVLADIPADILRAAALQYVSRGNVYFPQVGELREIAFDMTDIIEGRDRTPYDGWNEVIRLMRSHSIYDRRPIVFRDETAEDALAAIGGMRAVRFCNESSLPFLMCQFIKAYRTIQGRIKDGQRMLPGVKQLIARLAMDNLLGQVERKELAAGDSADETEWNG